MFAALLASVAFQVGPFYEQRDDYWAVRPFVSRETGETDVLWPVFTAHRDWWRFCYLVGDQRTAESDGHNFTIVPIWFNGRDSEKGSYWGFFPLWGQHPHIGMMTDFEFALWPVWHRYRMPRGRDWMETNAVLFPFVSWRDDGSWGFWPLYGVNHQRESDHRYALWPIVTWASYREDRDTSGAGYSWCVFPLYGQIRREREEQELFIPPFFSYARTWGKGVPAWAHDIAEPESVETRVLWPIFDYRRGPSRERISVWPLYESSVNYEYGSLDGKDRVESSRVTRFGWKLVELYDDETRVFPIYASGRDHFRIWPFWESETKGEVTRGRFLALFPIRWVPAVDRNWSKFWTFYENETTPLYTDHSLFWGIIRWRTVTE